ncbi:phosphonoacetate hydrolase [Mucilaginibacter pineti]|uniref:Phosphonoacetate hydrolase n=1 Tax=Mucilaginibacter pineti TaxID=1391627 RepID=A0A1G7AK66_9SPHI|nr:PhnA domain-containing protein [Mucilaginibacter pineti]SDE15298.1 phosphonoacetate hydrolase [Mucilaginibacter pineti]
METSNVKDSNGNILNTGDSVTLMKSLKVKGGGTTLKQGTLVKKSALQITTKRLTAR